MKYHLKSTRKPNKAKRFIGGVLGFLFLLLIIIPGVLFSISSRFAGGSIGFKDRITSGFDISKSYFTDRNKLVRHNDKLQRIVDEIEGYKVSNSILQKENMLLKGIRDSVNDQEIISEVISLPPQTPFDIMIIESGVLVEEGDMVLSKSGILIGHVSQHEGNHAKVKLLSAAKNTFFAENIRTGERYEMVGRSHGNYFTRLPKETDIVKGDTLAIRSGEVLLPVASIGEIEIRESSPFLISFAISPVSILSLQHVVIKKIYDNFSE